MKIIFDKIKNFGLLAMGALLIFSCTDSDDIATVSRITYFPDFILEGETSYDIACGESFTLPGARVEEEGTEIPFEQSITGSYFGGTEISTDAPDVYSVSYSAVNKDGFPGSTERIVNIDACNGDLVSSIAGEYTGYVKRTSNGEEYSGIAPIKIVDLGDGKFALSHSIGGFYSLGRGFGPTYGAYGGILTAVDIPNGQFEFSGAPIVPFGINIVSMKDFVVDPATGTFGFTSQGDFANSEFQVVLTQVN